MSIQRELQSMSPETILGRERELSDLDRFFEVPPPGALLLEGEAGIGKTTIWRESLRIAAREGRVLSSRASAAETRLSFTVLGDLLEPVLEETLPRLPVRQREALEAALLLGPPSASRPDARAVSLALLGALRTIASDGPIAIAIDDVQWIDPPSARTLVYALRRIDDRPLRVVATRRIAQDLTDPLDLMVAMGPRATRLALGPIAAGALGRVLREHLGRHVSPVLVGRIHEASGGNPLFAVEIGRALGPDPNPPPGEPLPVPLDLQTLLRHRLSTLSEVARDALLIVALSGQATFALVERVAGGGSGIKEAEEAQIVAVRDGALEFTHPLLAATVHAGATPGTRRDVHERLARVSTGLEERARHLALSTNGPDEEVAAVVEQAAQEAETRGAPSTAAELYRSAAKLTPPGAAEPLRRRWFGAAGNLWAAGDIPGARALNERMLETSEPGAARAHSIYIMASASWNDLPRVTSLLVRALDEVGEDRLTRAWILQDLAWATLWACDPSRSITWADAALEVAETLEHPGPLRQSLAAKALASAVLGLDAHELIGRGIALEGSLDFNELTTPQSCRGLLWIWGGRLDAAREALAAELDRRSDQARGVLNWEVRVLLAELEFRAGGWRAAAEHAHEAHDIVQEAGWSDALGQVLPIKSAIESALGDLEQARADGTEALALCQRMSDPWDEIQARSALGFLELTVGDHEACHAWLDPLVARTEEMGLEEPGAFPFIPDEVEALVALGALDEASRLVDRLERQGRARDRPLALATAARCRGLLAAARRDFPTANQHLRSAMRIHRSVPQPFELGRTLLVKGDVERRVQRRRDARASLGQALGIFDDLGARLWGERARRELERVGAVMLGSAALTPTERRVAELAAGGRTNRQIAQAMFVTVKTVEANMSRVLRKLDIRSRKELPAALGRARDGAR